MTKSGWWLVVGLALFTALNLSGQGIGIVSFTSVGAPDSKKIMDPTCAFASGTSHRVALYWGAATETDDRNLTQVGGSVAFLTGANAGTYVGGGRTIVTPGSTVNGLVLTFQVRGWNSAGGSTYEEAIGSGNGYGGKGPIFTLKTKDPNNALEVMPSLYQAPGYQGFTIWWESCPIIPEPSSIALTILAAAILLLFRRAR
jgi:hypothetical protein